jgi:integrase
MEDHEAGRVTGHLRVEERARGGRVWVATYTGRNGAKARRVLGPAWVKDSGRKTARGAPVWRANDGTAPEGALTPKAAQDVLTALLAKERGRNSRRPRQAGKTFGEAGEAFLRHAASVGGKRGEVSASTLRGYRSILRVLAEDFPPDLPLVRITHGQLEEYQERLLTEIPTGRVQPLQRSTVRHRMIVLRMILKRAVDLGWLGDNPAQRLEIIPQPQPDPDFNILEPSQVEAVARAVAAVRDEEVPHYRRADGAALVVDRAGLEAMTERRRLWADVVRVAAYTGLRLGELRALRWRDVDFANATLHVRRNAPTPAPAGSKLKAPKSRHGRSVPLVDAAAAVLDRVSVHLEEFGLPTDAEALVFPTREGGMLDDARVRRAFYRGLAAANLGHLRTKDNPMTFHDLRHVFGTIAVRAFPVTDVQAFMGHQSITTTMRYVHHVPRHDAAAKLSAAFAVDVGPEVAAAPAR